MADTVSTIDIVKSPLVLVRKCLNTSDGTGEAAVTKVDLSTLVNTFGVVPKSVVIEKIVYDIKGMQVAVKAAGTTPVVMALLSNFGTMCFKGSNGINSVNTGTGAGNVTFTVAAGATAGATYDITLFMRING